MCLCPENITESYMYIAMVVLSSILGITLKCFTVGLHAPWSAWWFLGRGIWCGVEPVHLNVNHGSTSSFAKQKTALQSTDCGHDGIW
jgi:hypothetical protein